MTAPVSSTYRGWYADLENSELDVYAGFGGASDPVAVASLTTAQFGFRVAPVPATSNLVALGSTSLMFSDLFLASGGVVNFNAGDVTITHSSNILAFDGGDVVVSNGNGLIVGGATQVTAAGSLAEVQIQGTTQADAMLTIGCWATGANAHISFIRSQNTAIGSNTVVADNDTIGAIVAFCDDGGDYNSQAARIDFAVDGAPGGNDTPGRITFQTTADGADSCTERWRLTSVGYLTSLAADAANAANVDGGIIATGGIAFTDVANAWIDDATHGTGTTATLIGNATIQTSSDMRLKTDIEDTVVNATELFRQLRVVDHGWGENYVAHEAYNARGRWTGMIAQEVVDIAPWIINSPGDSRDCDDCRSGEACSVHVDEDGKPQYWFVNYDYLMPTMVKGFQELDERVTSLEGAHDHIENGWLKEKVHEALLDTEFKDWLRAELV